MTIRNTVTPAIADRSEGPVSGCKILVLFVCWRQCVCPFGGGPDIWPMKSLVIKGWLGGDFIEHTSDGLLVMNLLVKVGWKMLFVENTSDSGIRSLVDSKYRCGWE